jgi:apolipoprotein N-acyltransferase
LPLGTEGVLDARLPAAIAPPLASSYGNYTLILLLLLGLSLVWRRRLRV